MAPNYTLPQLELGLKKGGGVFRMFPSANCNTLYQALKVVALFVLKHIFTISRKHTF